MYKKFCKRLIDIFLALFALPLVLITVIIFAPIIYFTDKGPVFYNAKRVGKNGKPFKMYKLRSMYVNSPDIRLSDGSTYNGEDDPRVTPVGRFIRKTSIDELPQIINVLQGSMSWIGPRPDPLDWLDRYPDDVKDFLKVRPGITGYSQAYFRNGVDGIEKMNNDLYYARNCSFLLDTKIFFRTIAVVLKRENTYKDTTNEVISEKQEVELKK